MIDDIERLANLATSPKWIAAYERGELKEAGDLPTGTRCVDFHGFEFVRNGFIKGNRFLGCKNTAGGTDSYCCTFVLVAVIESEPCPTWIYEDELPDGYPYESEFVNSRVIDGVRMFPQVS